MHSGEIQGSRRWANVFGVVAGRTTPLLALVVAACGGDATGEELTAIAQQAVFTNSGVDTQIIENDSSNYATRDRVSVRGDGSGSAPVIVGLVKWTVPANSGCIVTSASIFLDVISTSNQSFKFYPANRAWVASQANWTNAATAQAWQVAGAMGANDRGPAFAEFTPNSGFVSLNLGAAGIALVQSWVNQASSNKGIVVGHETHSDGFSFASFDSGIAGSQPSLTYSCQ